jgi:hypothetical protein
VLGLWELLFCHPSLEQDHTWLWDQLQRFLPVETQPRSGGTGLLAKQVSNYWALPGCRGPDSLKNTASLQLGKHTERSAGLADLVSLTKARRDLLQGRLRDGAQHLSSGLSVNKGRTLREPNPLRGLRGLGQGDRGKGKEEEGKSCTSGWDHAEGTKPRNPGGGGE